MPAEVELTAVELAMEDGCPDVRTVVCGGCGVLMLSPLTGGERAVVRKVLRGVGPVPPTWGDRRFPETDSFACGRCWSAAMRRVQRGTDRGAA